MTGAKHYILNSLLGVLKGDQAKSVVIHILLESLPLTRFISSEVLSKPKQNATLDNIGTKCHSVPKFN